MSTMSGEEEETGPKKVGKKGPMCFTVCSWRRLSKSRPTVLVVEYPSVGYLAFRFSAKNTGECRLKRRRKSG